MDGVFLSWILGTLTGELLDIVHERGGGHCSPNLGCPRGLVPQQPGSPRLPPRRLSRRYDHLKALIKRPVPFPTFHDVQNELLFEELTMDAESPMSTTTLYGASSTDQSPHPSMTRGGPTHPPIALYEGKKVNTTIE